MKINFDSLTDPVFLFIYWLVAGTLWVIIPLPPPAPEAAIVQPAPEPITEPVGPPPALESALTSLSLELETLDLDLQTAQAEVVAVEKEIEVLQGQKQRLQSLLRETGQELEALSVQRSELIEAGRLSVEQRRQLEAKLEKDLARQLTVLEDQLRNLRRQESLLHTRLESQTPPAVRKTDEAQIIAPRAISPNKLPVLVEIYKNRIAPVDKEFFDIDNGGLLGRGPRVAQRKNDGETTRQMVQEDSAVERMFSRFNPDKYYVSVLLNRDSFEAFRAFRRHAWAKGFDVGWMPVNSSAGRIELYRAKFVKKAPEGENLPEVAPIQK